MIFECYRIAPNRIRLQVKREPHPDTEVKLADARRALHDVRLVLHHSQDAYGRGADAVASIVKAAQEATA